MTRALIIDDELLARDLIKKFLEETDVEVVGECGDGFEGFKLIQELQPDLIFLDIMMPKLTGFEMLELIDKPPVVVFSTAYDEFAIKAFEQNAVDYLLKPYSKDRFLESLSKAKAKIGQKQEGVFEVIEPASNLEKLTRVAVKTGQKIHIIGVDDIHFIEAMDDYVRIHSTDGSYLKQKTMKFYESHLPGKDFLRVHRSFIVRLKEINKIEQMGKDSHVAILKNGREISVSRSGYTKLKEVLNF